jgi:hypothetical protein
MHIIQIRLRLSVVQHPKMPVHLNGTWKPVFNEGVDEYFKKIGM